MNIEQYDFLKTLDISNKVYTVMENFQVDNFSNIFFSITELLNEQFFVADYLPKSMPNNEIYSKYFNLSTKKLNHDLSGYTYDFNYYQNIYLKILIMLLGYCEEIYFETDLLQSDSDNGKYFGLELDDDFYQLTLENQNLFFELSKLALQDKGCLYVFLVDMHMIICINDMRLFCLFFKGSDLSFFEKIISTEGLYIYK